ncbi:Crp/Fnr family transcriptional regulator [Sulfitobacter sp. JL08]|uniref:Crp/Fnr family transcriptional regulator n=1 Tax=Sulfitobacter sp. JL08 TaxID=2070369 RepID=UPI0019631237|nr:Crp/Fnr family transcriptional regulator [Sulfitobacter sp. JL08]
MKLSHTFEILRCQGWLSQVPEEFARELVSRGTMHEVQRGTHVYIAGENQDGLRGIVSGAFAIEMSPFERGPNLLHAFRPGDWFGEAETFQDLPKVVNVIATRKSQFIYINLRELEAMIASDPGIWRWIGALASMHLITALGIIDDMTIRNPESRITALLLRLGGVRTCDNPQDPKPEIDATQSDLAHLTAVSRATVSEHLGRMEKVGVISKTYGRIRLIKTDGMRQSLINQNNLQS